MQQWEYKTIDDSTVQKVEKINADPEEELNELGQDGWELVATIEGSKGADSSQTRTLVFKRPKG